MSFIFEWDPKKAAVNIKNHRISFQEATTIFGDPLSITISDPDHSDIEARFLDVGLSDRGRLLVVSYIERGRTIRIISARRASLPEQKQYEDEPN